MAIDPEKELSVEEAFALIDRELVGKDTRGIKYLVSKMSIENIYFRQDYLYDLIRFKKGELSIEQLLEQINNKYKEQNKWHTI